MTAFHVRNLPRMVNFWSSGKDEKCIATGDLHFKHISSKFISIKTKNKRLNIRPFASNLMSLG